MGGVDGRESAGINGGAVRSRTHPAGSAPNARTQGKLAGCAHELSRVRLVGAAGVLGALGFRVNRGSVARSGEQGGTEVGIAVL